MSSSYQKHILSEKFFAIPDALVLLFVASAIYGLFALSGQFRSDFHLVTPIDLSLKALPYYAFLSASRGVVAYFISLGFTLVVGYAAAKSRSIEKIVIPMIDILQSIPVLSFLPGLVLGLTALFPHSNLGLELAAILLVFTGQVWNMTFSYYSSLKSVPHDLEDVAQVVGMNRRQRLFRLELPFSAVNLAWNSMLSMAAGWFFLSACEAFPMGNNSFQLPGLGSYMSVAVTQGNHWAMFAALVAMVIVIVFMDFFIWRPILSWTQRFRLEEVPGVDPSEPLMQTAIRESNIVRWAKLIYRQYKFKQRNLVRAEISKSSPLTRLPSLEKVRTRLAEHKIVTHLRHVLGIAVIIAAFLMILLGSVKLVGLLAQIHWPVWIILFRSAFWTGTRVFTCLVLATLWAVPVGIWIGVSPERVKIAQPIVQVLASFPAPMLYPIVLAVLFFVRVPFAVASMLLMLLGAQWYVLFNVLAGALRIPQELSYAMDLMNTSRFQRWRSLYIPSVFPALVTGWVTAAGAAWNASILAEWVPYGGQKLSTGGLGAVIANATEQADYKLLAASITLMVVIVVILNRGFWARVYYLAQNRFRIDNI